MSESSLLSIDRTLSGATNPGQSRPESNGKEVVLHIPQRHSLVGSYSSTDIESVYSTSPVKMG